jgi:hypothetical protein
MAAVVAEKIAKGTTMSQKILSLVEKAHKGRTSAPDIGDTVHCRILKAIKNASKFSAARSLPEAARHA